nr:peptidoglycan DD-metalloendopeptidase family protein [Micromonospora polyrhachis]
MVPGPARAALPGRGRAALPGPGRTADSGLVAAAIPAAGPRPVTALPQGSFRWPLDGVPQPVRRFDPPPRPWLPGHRGVDLADEPGVVVRTAGAGVVLFAGMVAGRPVVSVLHANGLRTTYEPVQPTVRTGDRLGRGDPIGTLLSGHPGCPRAACLHWGLRRGDDYLDPLALLGHPRVRLLPIRRPSPQRRTPSPDRTRPSNDRTSLVRSARRDTAGQVSVASRAGSRWARRSYSSARL